MKAKTNVKMKKQKRSYKKDTTKRISYIISTDVKKIQKMLIWLGMMGKRIISLIVKAE